jgi:hypothetical protein
MSSMTQSSDSREGIFWRRWNEETQKEIARRDRPVLLFVAPDGPLDYAIPFLRAIFAAMPANPQLRELLKDQFIPLYFEPNELTSELRAFGAGTSFRIAILSPDCITPLVTFRTETGDPARLVAEIALVLDRLRRSDERLKRLLRTDDAPSVRKRRSFSDLIRAIFRKI